MKLRKHLAAFMRGWLPKEFSLPSYQRIKMIDHFMRLHFLRLAYGVMLGALLVMPFGVYHSRVEPYITGYLWGYNLPIGYLGLLLGIAAVLYPRLNTLRSLRFSSFMPIIGLTLFLTFLFSPKDYFINLVHGTNFSSVQIDVDFAVGNSAVLGLSILSIAFGLVSFIRGWLPKEPNRHSIKSTIGRQSSVNKRILILFSVSLTCFVLFVGGMYIFSSWYAEQISENLKGYSARLEDDGFIVEAKPLTESHVDSTQDWYWFSDFRSYAKQEKVIHIYIDHEINGLYYLTRVSPTNDSTVAIIFYYNKLF
jgi:hypothetical protein